MMNKKVLALAVAAITSAGAVNAAELYKDEAQSIEMGGRAEARLAMKDGDAADNTRVRLNFKGTTQISDGLYGVGFWEGEFTTNDAVNPNGNLENRYTYAGIGGNFGEVTYGKNDGALGVITDFTDIMAYHGNSAAYKLAVADREDNAIAYKGQFGDFAFKANYRFDDAAANQESNDGFSTSGIYAFGDSGFKLGAGYADQGTDNEAMVAGSMTMGDFYFAGTFTTGEVVDLDYTGFEVAGAYTMGKTVFTATYNNADHDTNALTVANNKNADNFAVDATYFFNANFRTYISYNLNLLDDDASKGITKAMTEDEVALGMRYDF
ncbi:porin [Aliivibrio fischeri]|nr:porin [Aliivibrio fischeri]MUK70537.1 porin [Aliivibrio fischeri]MUK73957.1 porin [Aliivibrio fischeri]MUL21178.1 porin [Aliivibrio fischeri]MUL25131.1 porin [Aliivibrio fischeri]